MLFRVSLASFTLIALVLGAPSYLDTSASSNVRSMRSFNVKPSGGIETPLDGLVRSAKRTSSKSKQQRLSATVEAAVRSETLAEDDDSGMTPMIKKLISLGRQAQSEHDRQSTKGPHGARISSGLNATRSTSSFVEVGMEEQARATHALNAFKLSPNECMNEQVSINENQCEMQVAHTAWGPDMEWHGIVNTSNLPHGCVYNKIDRTVRYNVNSSINDTTTKALADKNQTFVFCHTENECKTTQVDDGCCRVFGSFEDWTFDTHQRGNLGFSNGFHQGGNYIHFKVKDSLHCSTTGNGSNDIQWGRATTSVKFSKATNLTMRWKMAGEPWANWDSMKISLTSAQQTLSEDKISPLPCKAFNDTGGTYNCAMCHLEDQRSLSFQENETVQFQIDVNTTDAYFHQDAFFEVSFQSSDPACGGCVCSPHTVYADTCTVTAYEHWAPNITGSESWATDRLHNASVDKAWKRDSPTEPLPTGRSKQVNGTGMFRLGALEKLASSIRVSGKCCEAWTWSSSTQDGACASGKSTGPILVNNKNDHPGHPGVVTPEFQLDEFGITNDDIECVQVKQSFCEDVGEHLNKLGTN